MKLDGAIRVPGRNTEDEGLARIYDGARRLREALGGLAEARATCDAVIEAVHEPLLVVSGDGRILGANPALGMLCECRPEELIGRRLGSIPGSLWSSRRLKGVLEAAATRKDDVRGVEVQGTCSVGGGRRVLAINARRMGDDKAPRVLLAFDDATLIKEAGTLDSLRRRYEADKELVARVSHEFRTPVAAIKGFAETLLRGGIKDCKHRLRFVRTIKRQSDWLATIVEELLTLYSLESDNRPPQPEVIPIADFLKRFAGGLAPLARKRRIRLKTSAEPELAAWADRDQLERALQSLCENALAHADRVVEVRGWVEDGQTLIQVRDDGPGIPDALLPHLFDGIRRPASPSQGRRGTGLGLRIARCAIDANRGRLWAENHHSGGALFKCLLPMPVLPRA